MADPSAHHRSFLRQPNIGRIYDYVLGGSLNTPSDRLTADELAAACPWVITLIRNQRAFLTRAVEYMLDRGVRQFVDLGSGLPTAGHVHSVANRKSTTAVTVYVDNDEETVRQAGIVLSADPNATTVHGDVADPASVARAIDRHTALDRRKSTGVLLVGTLDLMVRSTPVRKLLTAYRRAFSGGLHLAVTALVCGRNPADRAEVAEAVAILRRIGSNLVPRSRTTVNRWLAGVRAAGVPVDVGFTPQALVPGSGRAGRLSFEHTVVRYPGA